MWFRQRGLLFSRRGSAKKGYQKLFAVKLFQGIGRASGYVKAADSRTGH